MEPAEPRYIGMILGILGKAGRVCRSEPNDDAKQIFKAAADRNEKEFSVGVFEGGRMASDALKEQGDGAWCAAIVLHYASLLKK